MVAHRAAHQRKKRILFIEENQDGTIGGSYHSLATIVRCLDNKAYEPFIMFYQNNDMIDEFASLTAHPVIIFKKPSGMAAKSSARVSRFVYRMMSKSYNFVVIGVVPLVKAIMLLREHDIDLVEVNDTASGGWEWLLAGKLLGKKCIVHQRGFGCWSWLTRKRAQYFDKIICVSYAIKTFLDDMGLHENTTVIYNSIDPVKFRERITIDVSDIKNQFGVKLHEPMIGIVGNYQEWKGQLTVIKAVDILRRNYPDLVCLLIGSVSKFQEKDMHYFEDLKMEISCRGLKKNVIMTGYRSDVANLVNALDILIHASIAPEPFGRVILEGMTLAKPVIATNMGGPKEIIEDGVSGILVPPEDPQALAGQIDFLLRNQKVRATIGINGLQRVNERFNINTLSVNMSNMYSEIFQEKV